MNTYYKFQPNVFLAKCTERYEKGDTITLTTKRGKENEHIVFNLIKEKDSFFYYSIVRADGFNVQEWAKRRAEKLKGFAANAERRSDEYWKASKEGADFLALGEPIKVGHHSEKRHRALIERNNRRMEKCIEEDDKAASYQSRIAYWKSRENEINLSMPESLGYYQHKLEEAQATHTGMKNGTIERAHSYSLTYAKKAVNEFKEKVRLAKRLWG